MHGAKVKFKICMDILCKKRCILIVTESGRGLQLLLTSFMMQLLIVDL
jgi:hypothetical protein